MRRRAVFVATLGVSLFVGPHEGRAADDEIRRDAEFLDRVAAAVDRGVEWLVAQQRQDGSFRTHQNGYPGAGTALAYLTLRACGVARDDRRAERTYRALRVRYLHSRGSTTQRTYASALTMMAIEAHGERLGGAAEAKEAGAAPSTRTTRLDELDTEWMEELVEYFAGNQGDDGAWGYGTGRWRPGMEGARDRNAHRRDLSNTQYALLGLHAATRAGVDVPSDVYGDALQHLIVTQQRAGVSEDPSRVVVVTKRSTTASDPVPRGWGYQSLARVFVGDPAIAGLGGARGSMTAGAIGAVVICTNALAGTEELPIATARNASAAVRDGIAWLGENFTVERNPGAGGWHTYYLYALERAGVLAGVSRMGEHDWYGEGATFLTRSQLPTGEWRHDADPLVSTCFALLFLKRATSPVVTPSGSVAGIDFEAARAVEGKDLVDFVDLVVSRWQRSEAPADRRALQHGLASVGSQVLVPLLLRMGAGSDHQRAPAHELFLAITGRGAEFDPDASPGERSESLVALEVWVMASAPQLVFDADSGTLLPR